MFFATFIYCIRAARAILPGWLRGEALPALAL
jgi:hypothetical protein